MKKIVFIALSIGATYLSATAQGTRFGFTAGVAFSNNTAKIDGEKDHGKSVTGITAGILVDIPAGKHFSIQPAINFLQKGAKDEDMGLELKMMVNSIEVPLNFLYNTRGEGGDFFIGAGPSVAFALSGKIKIGGTTPRDIDMKFGNDDDDNLKGMDVGANILTGYCFSNGFFLSANYNLGLTNLYPRGSSDETLKSHYFGIKLGFLLKGKRN
jgi:Outer membrane protein beta-barrel domain